MQWMRRRGDWVTITTGKYTGQDGTVESIVCQKTVDYPDELANGYHVMLDTERSRKGTLRWSGDNRLKTTWYSATLTAPHGVHQR